MTASKPPQNKMATYQQRRVEIRLPDVATLEDWKAKAREGGVALSKFIYESVANWCRHEYGDDSDERTRSDLTREISELVGKLGNLKEDQLLKRRYIRRIEKEIEQLRSEDFLTPKFEGVRQYNERLIKVFKAHKKIRATELLSLLDLGPSDGKIIKSINVQLDSLESCGLITKTGDDFRWKG